MGFLPTRINRAACLALMVLATLLFLQIFTYHRNAPDLKSSNDLPDVMMNNMPAQVQKPTVKVKEKKVKPSPMSKAELIDFMKTQAAVQSKRKATLRQTCERRGVAAEKDPPFHTQSHMLVVENYKVMYCIVPMVETVDSSDWKRVMMVLDGKLDKGLPSEEAQSRARFFISYAPDQKQQLLKNYRKFFFVREPLKRVLSVYRNKFENVGYYRGNKSFHTFGKEIVTKFRKEPSAASVQTGENATWAEFVDYLTHPMENAALESMARYSSDHWKEIHKICSPCTIDYDVIGKLDTINDDAKYILNLIDAPSKVQYISSASSRPTNSRDKGTFEKYISQLDKKKLGQLWDLYKLDYELFSYSKPAIIPDK